MLIEYLATSPLIRDQALLGWFGCEDDDISVLKFSREGAIRIGGYVVRWLVRLLVLRKATISALMLILEQGTLDDTSTGVSNLLGKGVTVIIVFLRCDSLRCCRISLWIFKLGMLALNVMFTVAKYAVYL